MTIEKIHIDYFGNLINRTFELEEGLNIIQGDNESGKSTLGAFIKFIFYGLLSKSKDSELSERDRYINWNEGCAAGSLTVKTKNASYRIERAMIIAGEKSENGALKRSYRDAFQVIDLATNSPITITGSPGEYFFKTNEELYSKTCFVSQAQGTKVSSDKLTSTIENILFASDDEEINVEKALKKLDSARVYLLHKNEMGGKIYELEEKHRELEKKLANAKQNASLILDTQNSINHASLALETKLDEIKKLERKISAFETVSLKELYQKYDSIKTEREAARAQLNKIYHKERFIPDKDYITELENANDDLIKSKKLLAKLEENEKTVSDKANENKQEIKKEELQALYTKKKFTVCLSLTFFILSIVFGLLGGASVYYTYLPDIGKTVLAAAAFPFVFALIFFVLKLSTNKKIKESIKRQNESNKHELASAFDSAAADSVEESEALSQIQALRNDIFQKALKLDTLKSKLGENLDTEEALKLAREAQNTTNQAVLHIKELDNMLEMLKIQLKPYDKQTVYDFVVTDSDLEGIDAQNINEKRKAKSFLTSSAQVLKTRIHELEKTLASLYPLAEDPAAISEKLELANAYIKEYRKKHAAYLLASETIIKASEKIRENIAPLLAKHTSMLMEKITDGKYTDIGIDNNLKISVPTDDLTRSSAYLSKGTQDAAYISLRLALIKVLFKEELPTVILDESFASLDNTRLCAMLKLLCGKELSLQSIVFTSNDREYTLAQKHCEYAFIKLDR